MCSNRPLKVSILRDKRLVPKKCRLIDTTMYQDRHQDITTDHFTPRCACARGVTTEIQSRGMSSTSNTNTTNTARVKIQCQLAALRWQPSRIPTNCECGTPFSVEHMHSCPKGGYPSIRHNEIQDLSANLMSEVCNNVSIEPHMQPVTGEHLSGASANTQDGARLDIAANGLWGSRYERTYFDVRVFNPHATSNRNTNPSTCYRKHEKAKKRSYEQRMNILPSHRL